jgi:nucleotide-binding universal stress UspA family protein
MLAMATRGRTGMQRLIHGSVAGSIVDESPVPAVMITARHAETAG